MRLFVAMYSFVVAAVLLFVGLGRTSDAIDAPDCSRTVSIRWSRTSDRYEQRAKKNASVVLRDSPAVAIAALTFAAS